MKIFTVVMKVLAVLAAVAGAIYLAATYGDKIVAWAKKMLGHHCCCGECECECECEDTCECQCCEAPAEEEAAEEPAEEATDEPADEAEVVAAESDFEG